MDTVYQDALKLHEEHGGKIEIKVKVPLATREDLSLAYTPGVAQVSIEIGRDRTLAKKYTIKKNTVAVISDGSAILGLGNLGPEAAIPVMEGKAALFKEFANIDAFPICLATQDTEEIIATIARIAPVFGGINLEDIAAPRCFEIERRLKAMLDIPVMHDDQHGTATVVLAAMINAIKLRGLTKDQARIVINGAGAAGTAIADLLLLYGFTQVTICDSRGAIYQGREDLTPEKIHLAQRTNRSGVRGDLSHVLIGADIFIGVSKGNTLTADLIKLMNERPIICALANPIPEIMPDEAHGAGAFIVATGRSDFPNQINNVLAFPGIFRGALDHGVRQITDAMLVRAAEHIAGAVTQVSVDRLMPDPFDKRIVQLVAQAIQE